MKIEDLEECIVSYGQKYFGKSPLVGNSDLSKAFKVMYVHLTIVLGMDREQVMKREFIKPYTFKTYASSARYLVKIHYISGIYQGLLDYIISSRYKLILCHPNTAFFQK